jgi:spore coat polysaccharide biosynthesis protein SpsF
MSSNRLPGRLLAPLGGRPLLAQLRARIAAARVEDWWLATTREPADDVTEAWGFELGLRVFRGDGSDASTRIATLAREARAEWILRVSADHPFLDARLLDHLLDARDDTEENKHADLLLYDHGLPLGYEARLLRRRALEDALRDGRIRARVRGTSSLANHVPVAHVPMPSGWPARPAWRWTIDTYQDLAMARSAFRLFGIEAATIDYPSMVACLDLHPEITDMNQHVEGGGRTAW